MSNANESYASRPLATSVEYPGYQFYARLCFDGHTPEECFRYAALIVQNWLCGRIAKVDGDVPGIISCPPVDRFMDISSADLKSAKLSNLEIISLPDAGLWALMVHEPDPGIAARSYMTHVGIRKGENDVEFGVCVDVIDNDRTLPEQEIVFRPQFVRLLFETDGMTLYQAGPLAFKCCVSVSDRRGVERLRDLAADVQNQLPMVVFTRCQPPLPDMNDPDALGRVLDPAALGRVFQTLRSNGADPLSPGTTSEVFNNASLYHTPFDADELARHIYGFAQAFVVSEKAFTFLKARFSGMDFAEGDILLIAPKAFGGEVKVIGYRPGLSARWYKSVTDDILETIRRYPKHKPYAYGSVLFADDARQIMRQHELDELRAAIHLEQSGALHEVLALLERERQSGAEQARQIALLRSQMRDEYDRGEANERHRVEQLEAQIRQLKADNASLIAANEAMRASYAELDTMRSIVRRAQSLDKMPRTNEDVVAYFRTFFADRLAFTERGLRTASKCDINPDVLWTCLYHAAMTLADLYRDGVRDVENAFYLKTGWELSPKEGAMTRDNARLMNLRKDTFDGREISIEPHIKFSKNARQTGAQYQRLYYAYDTVTRKIIVGYVGDHLENFLTLSFH